MSVTKLITRRIEKVWGRRDLSPFFKDVAGNAPPVGEIWFEMPHDGKPVPELLVKYLFTSERLSVQVHPGDEAARARGHACGKDEAWLVLDATPGGTVGLGTRKPMDSAELRDAARDGSIEDLLDWKPVRGGEFIYSAAGTVHAIGAGVTLIEIQQNIDLTYRLYDYGRPRELHLDDGVAVADARPFEIVDRSYEMRGRTILCDGPKFTIERLQMSGRLWLAPERPVWLTVISGTVEAGECSARAGEVLYIDAPSELSGTADVLLAYVGAGVDEALVTRAAQS